MVKLGLVLPDEPSHVSLDDTVRVAKQAEEAGFHSVWKPEASWSNTFMMLSAIARETNQIALGTGIVNPYSRSPGLIAMSALTLDILSNNRTILGLGTSSPQIVEQLHGMSFDRPLRRLRESIEIVRGAYNDDTIRFDGAVFTVGPYDLEFGKHRDAVPIYNAAIRETNRRLTGEYADGWMPAFLPRSEMDELLQTVQDSAKEAGRDPDEITFAPHVGAAVSDDPAEARGYMRRYLAQEMAMGYNNVVREFGYGAPADRAAKLWSEGDFATAAAVITDEMIDDLTICGTPEDCRERLAAYEALGVDVVVLSPVFTVPLETIEYTIETLT